MKKQKIIIMGGGIGGLTVAHELIHSKGDGYDIHIYERNKTIGGMARSGNMSRKKIQFPTEYCWRIYGPNYHNLRAILKQIPLKDNPKKTVHDNLVDISTYLIADQGRVVHMHNRPKTLWDIRYVFNNIPWSERMSVLSKILYCFMISTERLNRLDRLSWNEYINPNGLLSHDMRKYIIDAMGPYLGAEPLKVNVPSVIKTLETFKLFNKPLSVMNGPTNEAWFDHWQAHLESKGVTFHLGTAIEDVKTDGSLVQWIQLPKGEKITGDVYFCSLPVESVAKLPSLKIVGTTQLSKRAHQLMVGVQLYFDKKIKLPCKNTVMHIPDSPWQLVIEPQGSIWSKSYDDFADIWSIGLCDPTRPGRIAGKPFIKCSHQEIQAEVWDQLSNSEFCDLLQLELVKILDFNVWHTYVYDGSLLDTSEPKFSTNKGTYFLRPENKTDYDNLYYATAYTKTKTDMFEMESAAESGRRAARLIDSKVTVAESYRPVFLAFYRWLDGLLPRNNQYQRFPGTIFIITFPIALIVYPFSYAFKLGKAHRDKTTKAP